MNELKKRRFILECESWIGTGWLHGVGLKGVKADCAHFISEVAKTMGWLDKGYKIKPYSLQWALHQTGSILCKQLESFCINIDLCNIEVGDILLYKFGRCNHHASYYLGNRIAIHSHMQHGVVKYHMDNNKEMSCKLNSAMRWKGNL